MKKEVNEAVACLSAPRSWPAVALLATAPGPRVAGCRRVLAGLPRIRRRRACGRRVPSRVRAPARPAGASRS